MFRCIEPGVWTDVARACESFRIGVVLAELVPAVGDIVFRMNFVDRVFAAGAWRTRRFQDEERAAMHVILGAILQGPAAPRLPALPALLADLRRVYLADVAVAEASDSGVYGERPPNKFRAHCVVERDFLRALIFLRNYLRERREERESRAWKTLLDSCTSRLAAMISAM